MDWDTRLTTGFELTDNLVARCPANHMYLILDLHAAPGGQGKDANISDDVAQALIPAGKADTAPPSPVHFSRLTEVSWIGWMP